jgi:hypothetical protein
MATTRSTTAATSTETEGLTTGLPADEYKREQEKGVKDPVSRAVEPTTKATAVDVAPGDPYPSGAPDPAPVERVPHNAEKPEWYEPVPPVAE